MKIEDYLASLPSSIITGEDVDLDDQVLRDVFRFAELGEHDIFYHLGCGSGKSVAIALEEFNVKKAVGIDNSEKKIEIAKANLDKQNLNGEFQCKDITKADLSDATTILFWFSDENVINQMIPILEKLQQGCKIITMWAPLTGNLPDKVNFPFILNVIPFRKAESLKDQMLAIFNTDCIDFVVAWEFAERYSKTISSKNPENDRFLTIIQTLVIWINAKNLGIACGDEIPAPVKSYIEILKNFFDIEVEHLLDH